MNQRSEVKHQGLYRSEYEHDACGVGMVANLSGEASHDIVLKGMTILKRLMHRGATGNDPETGDGAGLLMRIPHGFFKKTIGELSHAEVQRRGDGVVGGGEAFGVAMIFGGEGEEAVIENCVRNNSCEVLGWRDVPTNPAAIGRDARSVMPRIRQFFIARGDAEEKRDQSDLRDSASLRESAFERRQIGRAHV